MNTTTVKETWLVRVRIAGTDIRRHIVDATDVDAAVADAIRHYPKYKSIASVSILKNGRKA
jgi:hypothetical protein